MQGNLTCGQILYGDQVCGAPAWKTLCSQAYCTTHYSRFLQSLERSGMGVGAGLQVGVLCPEFGPGYAEVECYVCGATWIGVIGDTCTWCIRSIQALQQWQAELTLRPPDCELNDVTRPKRLEAWKERLKVARDAGIITREESKNAFGRELRRTG